MARPCTSFPAAMVLTALLSVTLSTPATATATATEAGDSLTAYEFLEVYDFPKGLLPIGVLGYDLDSSTGKFSAYLNGSCSFLLEDSSYTLKYRSTVSGYISKGKLTDLKGVSVKVLFFWLNIVEVLRSGDELQLSVGIASADYPVSNFNECPQCASGLDCGTTTSFARAYN